MSDAAVRHAELARRLHDDAILWASREQPILHRDGRPAPWAFYSWNVTHTCRGLRLAAEALLERLGSFSSTQLAGYGHTAAPLLSACVLLGEGRFTGLSIRDRPKRYLSCRQIEGPLDRERPVVLIDDSLSSGTSVAAAISALERNGFVVEGALALVGFPYRGGLEWATDRGYHVEWLFDIWRDIDPAPLPERPDPPAIKRYARGRSLPEKLHPAHLARRAAEHYLRTGVVPQPPSSLDDSYDARGGVFVSFRRRDSDQRVARDGFWRWDPAGSDPATDVVLATVETIDSHRASLSARVTAANINQLKIAVTFFGPLMEIEPRQLDFDRFGIVVNSRVFPHKVGGALPHTQVFTSEIAQYAHARDYNAGLDYHEQHVLYRHEVRKFHEPGTSWPVYGQPASSGQLGWTLDPRFGRFLCRRAVEASLSPERETPSTVSIEGTAATEVTGVIVGIYRYRLLGLGVAWAPGALAALVDSATVAALRDAGHDRGEESLAVVVSVLHHPEQFDAGAAGVVTAKIRQGLDAAVAFKDGRRGVVLPSALVYNNWTCKQQVAVAAAGVGSHGGEINWSVHRVASWVAAGSGVKRLRGGFVARLSEPLGDEKAVMYTEMLAEYLVRVMGGDGLPDYSLDPASGQVAHVGTAARAIHALGALNRAGIVLGRDDWTGPARTALRIVRRHIADNGSLAVPGVVNGPLAEAVLLAAIAELGEAEPINPECAALAKRVCSLIRPDGLICDGPARLNVPWDHQFLPGAVLKAVAAWVGATRSAVPERWLEAQLVTYQRHFRVMRAWGSAGWLPQGWSAVYKITHDANMAALVFEVVDWALGYQLEKNGAFLEDFSPDEPSFNTGFIAEGVASAWSTARSAGDRRRVSQYERSWRAALGFVATLVIHDDDTFALKAGERAVGGVRPSPSRSSVRIDQVSHALNALALGLENLRV